MRRLTADQIDELRRKGPFQGMGDWFDQQDQPGPDYVVAWPNQDRDGNVVNNLLGNTNPPAAPSSTNMLAATALGNGVTTLVSSFLTQPDYCRTFRLTTALAGANMDAGTVATLTYLDYNGQQQVGTVDVSGAAGNKDSTFAGRQLLSVVLPGYKAAGDTISIGYGPALGLPHALYTDSILFFTQDGAKTTYTLTQSKTSVAGNFFVPQNAFNGARKYLVCYKRLRSGN